MRTDRKSRIGKAGIAAVFGGSGFIGRYVVKRLASCGYKIRIAVRRPDLAFHLQPLGNVGQIRAMQANLRFPRSVEQAIEGANVVINLVGILQESGKQKFSEVHCEGARLIAECCKNNNAELTHISAIGADARSSSSYLSSKGEGEKHVRKILESAIILRPSIIFGSEDGFFNRFARMAGISPFLPLIGGGQTRFQPVYVGDVAKMIVLAADGKLSAGKIYELGGSEILTFRQCMELMLEQIGRNSTFIHIPWAIAQTMAKLTGWIPGAPLTLDQVKMLKKDTVVSEGAIREGLTLKGVGINPETLASVLPGYLVRFRRHGQFEQKSFSRTGN